VGAPNHVLDGGPDPPAGNGTCRPTRHPLDNGRVQSSWSPDATNSMQQGRHAAAMRAVATDSEATCFNYSTNLCYLGDDMQLVH